MNQTTDNRILKAVDWIGKRLILLVLFFYYVYPQALDTFGHSFVFASGIVGAGVYVYHRMPFKEVVYALIALVLMVAIQLYAIYINGAFDPYIENYMFSHLASFMSCYLIILVLFKFEPNASVSTVSMYIIAAVTLQAIISLLMYNYPEIKEFLVARELPGELNENNRAAAEGARLIGHGMGYFGAGVVYGYALIILAYVIAATRKNVTQVILLTAIYMFLFYIGMFSARTTVVGGGISLGLIGIYLLLHYKRNKTSIYVFMAFGIVAIVVGYILMRQFFPHMADWAFELVDNYQRTGRLWTKSSNGLEEMFFFPDDFKTFMIGRGEMWFWGNDVGFTRLVFFSGIIGMTAYLLFPFIIICMSFTRDMSVNLLLLVLYVFQLAINVKGLTDLNNVFYLYFFYFCHYKYYIYRPKVYMMNKQRQREFEEQKINAEGYLI